MKSRLPSESANRGKDKVAAQANGKIALLSLSNPLGRQRFLLLLESEAFSVSDPFMSGCPSAKSAACPFCVGMLFQTTTRLCPRSVTYNLVPSDVTDTGFSRVLAVADTAIFVRSGSTK